MCKHDKKENAMKTIKIKYLRKAGKPFAGKCKSGFELNCPAQETQLGNRISATFITIQF